MASVTEPAPTLNQLAYERIEELIVTLEIAPGAVLSEALLSRRIEIGTTPIREALQRLAREHLVRILPRRGVVVTEIDLALQLQVLETRRELDRLIARSAARHATPAEREALGRIAEGMAERVAAGDRPGFLQFDARLNAAAALAARNEVAARCVASLHSVARRFWFHHQSRWPGADRTLSLHVELARALASGDVERAGRASDAVIDDLDAFARSTVAPL